MDGVKRRAVLVDKFGMAPNVFVSHLTTGMEVFVCNVLMGKFGTQDLLLVIVKATTFGMETIAKRKFNVREDEFGTKLINSAFAHEENSGMGLLAWSSLIVAAIKDGIRRPTNVSVQVLFTGMEILAFCA